MGPTVGPIVFKAQVAQGGKEEGQRRLERGSKTQTLSGPGESSSGPSYASTFVKPSMIIELPLTQRDSEQREGPLTNMVNDQCDLQHGSVEMMNGNGAREDEMRDGVFVAETRLCTELDPDPNPDRGPNGEELNMGERVVFDSMEEEDAGRMVQPDGAEDPMARVR